MQDRRSPFEVGVGFARPCFADVLLRKVQDMHENFGEARTAVLAGPGAQAFPAKRPEAEGLSKASNRFDVGGMRERALPRLEPATNSQLVIACFLIVIGQDLDLG
jgi:hypothetical protein